MLIDIEVASCFQRKIKSAVFRKKFEHVVEKTNAGRDLVTAAAVDHEPRGDLRFFRFPFNGRFAHQSTSSISLMFSITASAPSASRSSRTSSEPAAATPMKRTPALRALCASSTVSP